MRISTRLLLVMLHDLVATVVSWLGAYWLRFNLGIPESEWHGALSTLLLVVPLETAIFWRFGLYRGIWRFASLPDLRRIVQAVTLAAVAVPAALIMFRLGISLPRTVLVLNPVLLIVFLGGSRFAYRAWKEPHSGVILGNARPALVLGAGAAADRLLREFSHTASELRIIGLLDDDPAKHGLHIQELPVLGTLDQLAALAKAEGVKDAILAIPSAPLALRQCLLDACAQNGITLLTVPSLDDIVQGRVSVAALRKIELDDLLGRPPVRLDSDGLYGFLQGRTVMVTGAGGSIGSELVRQIAAFKPARLVLYELSEFALYQLEQELLRDHPEVAFSCLIGDVKDRARVDQVLREHAPAVVFHAAAYKHVPLMERENALQALKNNVLGTWVTAKAASAAGVEKFVLVSTDKAVNPSNVMGASKRLAEMLCQALQAHALAARSGKTAFLAVRFGNVLGSSGSVIPKFQKQIEAGGPVTVTHPEITRYFMSIPEAAQLVMQAGMMGKGGEIFVLDMGAPIRIVDLARLMIRLSGKDEEEIRIEFTGLRPGEKLYEELLADSETTLPTPHPQLRVAKAREVDADAVAEMLDWVSREATADEVEVRIKLGEWLPEYRVESRELPEHHDFKLLENRVQCDQRQ
jgi:FlaA1/EpsC-like NDP-sugar epimerase